MPNEIQSLRATFPIVVDFPVAWGEMDAFGHVNNAVYFRYFENARIEYARAIGFVECIEVGPILASTHCRFRRPITYPDRLHVGCRATEIADDRFTIEYRLVSEQLDAVAAEGGGVVVSYDYPNARKAPLPDAVRAAIERLERSVGAAPAHSEAPGARSADAP